MSRVTCPTPLSPSSHVSIGTSKSSNVVLAAAAAAPVVLGAFGLLLALGVPPVVRWFWPESTTNVAEAAALGEAARVRALVTRGAALDVPLPVRAGLLDSDEALTITPLEAAVRRKSEDSLVPVLLDLGARPSPQEARRLYCLAIDLDA